MKKSLKIVGLILICCFLGQVAGYSTYYELVGKWVDELLSEGVSSPSFQMPKSSCVFIVSPLSSISSLIFSFTDLLTY